MLFREIKPNHKIYIFNKQDATYMEGIVSEVSFPRFDTNFRNGGNNQQGMVIDVTIKVGNNTATYTIPENLSTTYANSLVLSTEQQPIIKEIEATKTAAEQVLASIDKHREIFEKSSNLLTELNPDYRERKANEERFNNIEKSVDDMKKLLTSFIEKWEK